jgi:hypothetical protein
VPAASIVSAWVVCLQASNDVIPVTDVPNAHEVVAVRGKANLMAADTEIQR